MKRFAHWEVRAGAQRIGRKYRNALRQSRRADLGAMASSLAFTTVLSIVPLLAVVFYVFDAIGGLEYGYARLEPFLLKTLSEGTGDIVSETLRSFVRNVKSSAVGWAGVAGLFFTAVTAYLTVDKAFRKIWEVESRGPVLRRIGRALTVIVVGPILAFLSIAVTTAVAAHVRNVPFTGTIMGILLNVLLFWMTYELMTPVRIKSRNALAGALLPALCWEVAKIGFAVYTSKVVSYSKFYGSLGAIPLFLLWIHIGWYITLFGAVYLREGIRNA